MLKEQELQLINLYHEIESLEQWITDHPDALREDIIQVRMEIIKKIAEIGILTIKTKGNEFNSKPAEAN